MIASAEKLYIDTLLPEQKENDEFGLLHGKAGMAIVYYLSAKYTGNKTFSEKGLELLNEIAGQINTIQYFDYAAGLAGIGWGIEWLVQQKLLADTNTDDVLSDVDDVLYTSTLYDKERTISLLYGSTGKMAYFFKRFTSRNEGYNHIKNLYQQECVALLTDDLSNILTGERGAFKKTPFFSPTDDPAVLRSLVELGSMLCHLSTIKGVNVVTVENVLYETVAYVEAFFDKLCEKGTSLPVLSTADYYANVLFLAAGYEIAARNMKHAFWQQKAVRYIEDLHHLFEEQQVFQADADPFRKLSVYSLLRLAIPENPVYGQIVRDLLHLCQQQSLPFRIADGTGLITLCQLSLAAPGLVDNWFELFIMKH